MRASTTPTAACPSRWTASATSARPPAGSPTSTATAGSCWCRRAATGAPTRPSACTRRSRACSAPARSWPIRWRTCPTTASAATPPSTPSWPLRVGITQSVGIRALPDIVRRFGRDWPLVRIQPRESETDLDLYGGVESAELDLTFVELPAPPGPYETLPLLVDPYVLIVRSASPPAHRPPCPTPSAIGPLELLGTTQYRGIRRHQ